MTADDFDDHMRRLGYAIEVITGANNAQYTVIKDITIRTGSLKGTVCDVALQRTTTVPYVPPAAIHTRPHLLPMNSSAPFATQAGHIGPEWQYWSRRYERPPTPRALWAHILTVLGEM